MEENRTVKTKIGSIIHYPPWISSPSTSDTKDEFQVFSLPKISEKILFALNLCRRFLFPINRCAVVLIRRALVPFREETQTSISRRTLSITTHTYASSETSSRDAGTGCLPMETTKKEKTKMWKWKWRSNTSRRRRKQLLLRSPKWLHMSRGLLVLETMLLLFSGASSWTICFYFSAAYIERIFKQSSELVFLLFWPLFFELYLVGKKGDEQMFAGSFSPRSWRGRKNVL